MPLATHKKIKMDFEKLLKKSIKYKSVFGIYKDDLDKLYIEKIKLLEKAINPSFFVEELSLIQNKINDYTEENSAVLKLLSNLEEKIEELKLFEQELNENRKGVLLKEINEILEILEVYKVRKETGLSMDEKAEYCNLDYTEIDGFFKSNFGYLLPESMKTQEELITQGRSRFQIRKCNDFVKCKKNKICPNKIDLFDFLTTVDSFKLGDFFTISDIDRFLNLDINNYYGIGCFGHGVNTNGFFYLRIDDWRKYYFRFHTGGIYTPFQKDEVGDYIKCFVEFENAIRGKVINFQIVQNLNSLDVKINHKDKEINKSFYNVLIKGRIQKIFDELKTELFR